MATPTFALLLTTLHTFVLLYLSSAFGISTSEKGPRALLSYKISSVSNLNDDQSLTSMLSKQVLTSEINFCTLPNRACSSKLNTFKPFDVICDVHEGIDKKSPHIPIFDSLFFKESTLIPGNKIHVTEMQEEFPGHGDLETASIWVDYGRHELEKLLAQPFVPKEAIQSTILKHCNMLSLKGSNTQSCTKSLEQLVNFSKTALGSKHLVALTSKSTKIKDTGKELQIGNVQKFKEDNMVTCHGVLLDSATYFCHLIPTTLYIVDVIKPETKASINTVWAMCHKDTFKWPKDHIAFKILKSSPGKTEVCHWSTDASLMMVSNY